MGIILVCVSPWHLPQPKVPEVASILQRPRKNTGGAGEAAEQNSPYITVTFSVLNIMLT